MSSEIQCKALNNAIKAKGYSLPQIAQNVGFSEQRVSDIFSGRERPTRQEFNQLATSLGIANQVPNDSAHATA